MEDVTQELAALAATLYGSKADLGFVTRMTGKTEEADEIRTLLKTQFGLVQDPMTETWMQLLPGRLKMTDLNGETDG